MKEHAPEIAIMGMLALVLCTALAMLVWSDVRSSMDVHGYRPYRDGERVTCVYNAKALYCSEE
jgi:hypothetical protein